MDSVFLAVGYGIGFIIFMVSGYWRFIYLCGFVSSFLFVFNISMKVVKIIQSYTKIVNRNIWQKN